MVACDLLRSVLQREEEGKVRGEESGGNEKKYSPEEKVRFLPANTVTEEDHAWAIAEVRKMGLDPEAFTNRPTPTGP